MPAGCILVPMTNEPEHQLTSNPLADHACGRVILLTGSQIETTLCFLDGIIRHHLPGFGTSRVVLGTLAEVYPHTYPPEVEHQLFNLFRHEQPNFVFVSLVEFGLTRLLRLLEHLRKEFSFFCIAGGPYAIEYPNDCANTGLFDVVNYSHGLHSWRIIDHSGALSDVPNIMYRSSAAQGAWVRNPPSATAFSMDDMPSPYWGLDNLHLLVNPSWWEKTASDTSVIVSMKDSGGGYPVEHHQWPARHSGVVVLSTGCPVNTCDFCSISRMYDKEKLLFKEEFPNKRHALRKVSWWSPERAISLLENYVSCRPNTRYFVFNDNDFASIPKESVEQFFASYKNRVGLPFYCQSSPHLTLAKGASFVATMVDAGLHTYCMGVESDECSNKSMYSRRGANKLIFDAVSLFEPYMQAGKVHLALDFINGNAAETREDLLSTINMIRDLPLPWDLAIHNLTLNEDTPLAQRIKVAEAETAKSESHAPLHDIYLSDYHHANLPLFLAMKECWLNLVLQWLGGRHDKDHAGCFLRSFDAFSQQDGIRQARAAHADFDSLIRQKQSRSTCYEFITDQDVIDFMHYRPEVVVTLYQSIPEITYGYHEPDRFVFYWDISRQYQET